MSSVLMWCGEDRQLTVAWLKIHAVTGDRKIWSRLVALGHHRRHQQLTPLVPIWELGETNSRRPQGADLACLPS